MGQPASLAQQQRPRSLRCTGTGTHRENRPKMFAKNSSQPAPLKRSHKKKAKPRVYVFLPSLSHSLPCRFYAFVLCSRARPCCPCCCCLCVGKPGAQKRKRVRFQATSQQSHSRACVESVARGSLLPEHVEFVPSRSSRLTSSNSRERLAVFRTFFCSFSAIVSVCLCAFLSLIFATTQKIAGRPACSNDR